MTDFTFQFIIFALGAMTGVSINIALQAYGQAAKHGRTGTKVVRGDMTGGSIVGRHNMATMTINGRSYTGSNIQMIGDRILVDGVDVTDQTGVDMTTILEVKITGDVQNVSCDRGLSITGTVRGNVDSKGAVSCDNVEGDVKAAGAVSCDDVKGNVTAGGSVSCDDVGGSVSAGGRVSHG